MDVGLVLSNVEVAKPIYSLDHYPSARKSFDNCIKTLFHWYNHDCTDLNVKWKNRLKSLFASTVYAYIVIRYFCRLAASRSFLCMIKIFMGGGRGGGWDGGSSERCFKWGSGRWGSLRDISKNILKQGVGEGNNCS